MSGHSKWATIRRKKAVVDAKRGKVFTKLIREITVAARAGGGDPDMNPRLRLAVANAKTANMPQENITRAIQKGTGELEGVQYDEVSYEGFAAGGAAILVDVVTDNRNRTVAEVRHLFAKHNGSLGTTGSVAWMFKRVGVVVVPAAVSEDRLMEVALEAGAEDISRDDDEQDWTVTTSPDDFEPVRAAVEAAGIEILSAELTFVAKDPVKLEGKEASQVVRLVDALEDHDDVQGVHSTFEVSDEEYERIMGD